MTGRTMPVNPDVRSSGWSGDHTELPFTDWAPTQAAVRIKERPHAENPHDQT